MENVNDSIDVMVFIRHPVSFFFFNRIETFEIIWHDFGRTIAIVKMSDYLGMREFLIKDKQHSIITEIQRIIPKMKNKSNFNTAYNGYYQ